MTSCFEIPSLDSPANEFLLMAQAEYLRNSSQQIPTPPSHLSNSEGSSQNTSFPHPSASQLNDEDSLESLEAQHNQYGVQANASQSSLIVAEDELLEGKNLRQFLNSLLPLNHQHHWTILLQAQPQKIYMRLRCVPEVLMPLLERLPHQFRNNGSADFDSWQAKMPPSSFVATHPSDLLSEDNPNGDNLDIIPDSEPPVPSATTPTRDIRLNESPTKRPFCPLSPISELSSGEIVADSVEVHESSQNPAGDVPLATLLQVKSAAKLMAVPASCKMQSSMMPSIPLSPVLVKKVTGLSLFLVACLNKGHPQSVKPQVKPSTAEPKSSTHAKKAKEVSGEIPSSAPEQDQQDQTLNGKGKEKVPPAPTRKSICTHVESSAKKHKHPLDTEASDDCQDETHPTPNAKKQEEEESELTDDANYMDVGPTPKHLHRGSGDALKMSSLFMSHQRHPLVVKLPTPLHPLPES
ncbi:hypothetical protein F4604DRAFT_2038225 [Suillus subluteus]|nr:hypothetical protein F4604DRAFT_2038225 [Suillus subluteus]